MVEEDNDDDIQQLLLMNDNGGDIIVGAGRLGFELLMAVAHGNLSAPVKETLIWHVLRFPRISCPIIFRSFHIHSSVPFESKDLITRVQVVVRFRGFSTRCVLKKDTNRALSKGASRMTG